MPTPQISDYPCPACGASGVALFLHDGSPSGAALETGHPATSCAYACEPCLSAAKLNIAGPLTAPSIDLTATNHR